MSASRNVQLAQRVFEGDDRAAWHQARLEIVRPQQRKIRAARLREAWSVVLLAVMVFCWALAYMYLEARINAVGRELVGLENSIAEVEKSTLIMELEIGNLSSLSRVESYAVSRLGMVYPDVNSVQYLNQQASIRLSEDYQSLQKLPPEQPVEPAEGHPLLLAWAELIGHYFGDNLALSGE